MFQHREAATVRLPVRVAVTAGIVMFGLGAMVGYVAGPIGPGPQPPADTVAECGTSSRMPGDEPVVVIGDCP